MKAELVLAELLELAPAGMEEVDVSADVVEYAVYGAPGEVPSLPDLTAAAGGALIEVRTDELADNWADRWREFHQPLVLDGRLTVRPPWEPAADTPIDLVIDPGQAFGTGAHATTRLCLELILSLTPGGPFADLGCGSGVLAIAAGRLGWAPVLAFDNDPAAIQATIENGRANAVSLEVRYADLRTAEPPGASTVVANLLTPLLLALAPRLPADVDRVIAGGMLVEEADAVTEAFTARGLREAVRLDSGPWAALRLDKRRR
jgi:ribosomal protein L11 methyltransferase